MEECTNCKKVGGFLEVRNRTLPLGKKEMLCNQCYKEKSSIENDLLIKEEARQNKFLKLNETILRRMKNEELEGLCNELAIPLSREKRRYSRKGGKAHREDYTHTYDLNELVSKILHKINNEELIDYVNRRCENLQIDDIIPKINELKNS